MGQLDSTCTAPPWLTRVGSSSAASAAAAASLAPALPSFRVVTPGERQLGHMDHTARHQLNVCFFAAKHRGEKWCQPYRQSPLPCWLWIRTRTRRDLRDRRRRPAPSTVAAGETVGCAPPESSSRWVAAQVDTFVKAKFETGFCTLQVQGMKPGAFQAMGQLD
jgi:hypothetical protein